jgi:hypothetical protein
MTLDPIRMRVTDDKLGVQGTASFERNPLCAVHLILRGLCVAMLLVAVAGCALLTSPSTREQSATGGIDLRMFVHDHTGAEALYVVHKDGTFEFGGGMAARLDKTFWTGAISADEGQQLQSLIEENRWFEDRPKSTNQPESFRYRIHINSPQGRTRITLKGQHPRVEPVRQMLDRIALRRLDSDLQQLPQPSANR